jgi:hypothetical protein
MTHIETFSFGGAFETVFSGIGKNLDSIAKDITKNVDNIGKGTLKDLAGGSKTSIKDLSGSGAKTSIKDLTGSGAKSSIKDAVETGASKVDDIVETGASKVDDIAETGASKVDDIADSGSKTLNIGDKTVNTATVVAEIKDLSKYQNAKAFLKDNRTLIIAGVAITAGVTVATIAGVRVNNINSMIYTITSIKPYPADTTKTIIYYDPKDVDHKPAINDSIAISKSNCLPNIDGNFSISRVGLGNLVIDKTITSIGTSGEMRVQTSFGNQLASVTTEAVNTVVTPVVQTIADVLGGVLGGVADTLGLGGVGDFLKNSWWIVLIICIVSIMSSMSVFLLKFVD